ncbi:hypothetical protein ACA910_022018 [Epithemia clementina (nom. ined.)]
MKAPCLIFLISLIVWLPGHHTNKNGIPSVASGLAFAAGEPQEAEKSNPWWKSILGYGSSSSSNNNKKKKSGDDKPAAKVAPSVEDNSQPNDAALSPPSSSHATANKDDAGAEQDSDLKSPLLNRELTASVKAHAWPTLPSNALCETMAFFQQEDNVLQQSSSSSSSFTNHGNNDDNSSSSLLVSQFLDLWTTHILRKGDDATMLTNWKTAITEILDTVTAEGEAATPSPLNPFASLLQWSLQLRANAPLCELHRGLARQTLQQINQFAAFGDNTSEYLAVLFSVNRPAIVWTSLDQITSSRDWNQILESSSLSTSSGKVENSNEEEETMDMHLLPQELPLPGTGNATTASSLLILYSNLDSAEFAQTYRYVQESLVGKNIPVLVRYLGAIHYEENPLSAEQTTLAGYGVRLDIRNVEYKVFDERKSSSTLDQQDQVWVNLTESKDVLSSSSFSYLAGVNITKLAGGIDAAANPSDSILELRNQLWNKHEAQQLQAEKIPPLWQRRQLPLQAASVLTQQHKIAQKSGGGDVLSTLTQIAQDLPSVASTLVQVKIPPHIHEWASAVWEDQEASTLLTAGQFYINGRPSSVNRPSFNVFEILNVIRMEERRVRNLEKTLLPYVSYLTSPFSALLRLQDAWMAGSNFGVSEKDAEKDEDADAEGSASSSKVYRVDIGRGWQKSVLYLNDVEKDQQYKQWTRNFQQMLMSMQFGMPPSVRRNLYTMTLVLDPTTLGQSGLENAGFDFAMKLVQNQYPIRLGLVFVDDQDLEKCKEWLQDHGGEEYKEDPCPVEPRIVNESDDWAKTRATARAVHRLINYFLKEFGALGATLAFVEYYFNYVAEKLQDEGVLTVEDLVNIYSTLVEMMGAGIAEKIEEGARSAILEQEAELTDESENVYAKSVRFAVERGLRPGMSFLNGRPLPESIDGIHSTFSDEQRHLVNMIVKGEITDSTPRSIYGKLLSGPSVFKQMHTLLLSDENSAGAYQPTHHSFGSASLLIRGDDSDELKGYFVMDVVLDYARPAGLAQLKHLVESIERFPSSLTSDDTDSAKSQSYVVGYRILPSSKASAESPLCPVLAHAGQIGIETLKSLVALVMESSEEQTTLEDLISSMDQATGKMIASARNVCRSFFPDGTSESEKTHVPRIVCNGRVYEMGNNNVVKEDIDLLISLEMQRAAAVFDVLKDFLPEQANHGKIAESVASVAQFLAMEQTKSTTREDVMAPVRRIEKKLELGEDALMRFQWNEPTGNDDRLKSRVTAIVDPVHISTQRLAPLLEILRDQLELPVTIVLVPAPSIGGDSNVPITSYYRFVAAADSDSNALAHFSSLPVNHVLTLRMDIPEPWDVQQTLAIQDTDNLRCDLETGCSDDAHMRGTTWTPASIKSSRQITNVEYGLSHLLVFGQCYEASGPPNGLQLVLSKHTSAGLTLASETETEVAMDGQTTVDSRALAEQVRYSDTLVMKNVGYWQLRANPGVWEVKIDENSKGAEMFDFSEATMARGRLIETGRPLSQKKKVVLKDFVNRGETLFVKRRPGYEKESLFFEESSGLTKGSPDDGLIHVFSLATGHLYERFLKIMMLSVTKRTSSKVKFWLFENFLSPTFKATSRAMAERIGCEVEFVTYKWPEWLRGQTEKQRIIWGYKILFLDVLFPLSVKKIIYVDADQVVRADLKELWDMDLKGAPYGYTPFCSSRETTVGYQFWRDGFWKTHLRGKPYHISALYVVDLVRFREELVGDQLRSTYQQLSADPNSLANLDQDLPNYAQHQVRIFSLPQDWLWCESWCSDETKATAKTIDLCNNPLHKEPKVSMAKRIIDGPLFNESWVDLDAEVELYENEYLNAIGGV